MQTFVIENSTPGVLALLNTIEVSRPIVRQPSSTFFMVGYAPFGPVNEPTVITSFGDYVRTFGPFDDNSFIDDAAYIFFNYFGGKQCVIVRVVGAAAAVGSVTLMDRAVVPVATERIEQKYPSSRARTFITVENGTQAGTFKYVVRDAALGFPRETHDNLTLAQVSIDEVNKKSQLIRRVPLVSGTAAPNNIPAIRAETQLIGGTDDFASLTPADYVGVDTGTSKTGLRSLEDEKWGGGQVAIPGQTTALVHAALTAHGNLLNRLALPDPAFGSDKADMAAYRALYGSWHMAWYWPWVKLSDLSGLNLERFYPPSSFAAGACAFVDRKFGTQQPPAGKGGVIPNALDVERYASGMTQTDDATHDFLNSRQINVIKHIRESGVQIYGARVPTDDPRITAVHQARLMHLLYYSARAAYAYAPFSTIDGEGKLFRDLQRTGQAFLSGMKAGGAFYGKRDRDAFTVKVDNENNPLVQLEQGRVTVDWFVHLVGMAEQVLVRINNVPLFQDLSTLTE